MSLKSLQKDGFRYRHHVKAIDEAHALGFKSTGAPRRDYEAAFVHIIYGLRMFAKAHAAQYDGPIGDDGVLGECWLSIARGLVGMLNGDTGRLDAGAVDGSIRDLANDAGFTRDLEYKP